MFCRSDQGNIPHIQKKQARMHKFAITLNTISGVGSLNQQDGEHIKTYAEGVKSRPGSLFRKMYKLPNNLADDLFEVAVLQSRKVVAIETTIEQFSAYILIVKAFNESYRDLKETMVGQQLLGTDPYPKTLLEAMEILNQEQKERHEVKYSHRNDQKQHKTGQRLKRPDRLLKGGDECTMKDTTRKDWKVDLTIAWEIANGETSKGQINAQRVPTRGAIACAWIWYLYGMVDADKFCKRVCISGRYLHQRLDFTACQH